ncbi:hypothetical protein FQN54_006117 [Arachnomyces sp. PD_36]|nr:hypothetical protein FQN54_006117 [Arachnomyces sp. PD_36]
MSTSSQSLNPPPHPAPWHQALKSHLTTLPSSPEFVLSTLSHNTPSPNPPPTPIPQLQPRARYCIFRGFWCEDIELHPSTQASLEEGKDALNPVPGVYESEMLTFTTDVRMGKVGELSYGYGSGSGSGGNDNGNDGGGGGYVEAVFWVKEVMSQWRVRGRAYVLGAEEGEGEERARRGVRGWMRRRGGGGGGEEDGEREEEWSWEREVTAHFANLSPVTRGSFKNPPPGTPKPKTPSSSEEPTTQLGQKVHDLHDPIARKNFRVVVILPEVVEWVDMKTPEEARRLRWTLTPSSDGDGGQARWEEVELWP